MGVYRESMVGKNNPAYKHGLSRKTIKYKCPICHKKVMQQGYSKSCRKCYYKTLSGTGNPMYGRNRGRKKYYCVDCNKELSANYPRCHSCACKYIWQTSKKMQNRDISGKSNPNYKNGLSNEPYPLEFNEELKEKIRQRDNYTCQNCNMIAEEHLMVLGIALPIHHIDYNKKNSQENNLITLCTQCNIRANYNREYWKQYYKEKLNVWSVQRV